MLLTIQNITPKSSPTSNASSKSWVASNSTRSDNALSTITNCTTTTSPGVYNHSSSPPPYSEMPSESHHLQSLFYPFPPAYDMVKLVRADKPDQQFGRLSKHLFEAGIFSSEQILLCPEDVLYVIGDMGLARARTLRNYAKRIDMNKLTCASRPSRMRGRPGNAGLCTVSPVSQNVLQRCFIARSLIPVYHRMFQSLTFSFKDICNAISLSSWVM